MTEKIYYVYVNEEFKGYVVATSDEIAKKKASLTLTLDIATITVKDTGATKPKCCPRR